MLNLYLHIIQYFLYSSHYTRGGTKKQMLTTEDYMKAFHEIKNSITIINSSLQLVEKNHPEIFKFEYWQESRQALDYLRAMVLELSQARLSEDLCLHPISPNYLLQNILATIRSLQYSSDFHCQAHISENLPIILADSFRLTQAIMNLIKNAYEAMNEAGTILLNAYEKEGFLHISIIDFGGGIQLNLYEQLFVPFVTSKPNGTGLGLTITKQIIENHHGYLNFESRPNDGTTFFIKLPILA